MNSPAVLPEGAISGRPQSNSAAQKPFFRRSVDARDLNAAAKATAKHQHALTDRVRGIVSREKRRFKAEGYDLDLSYITSRIIAMGFPASDFESIYRNNAEDVYDFFEEHHAGRYKLYNLCSERSYPQERFHGRVARFPFDDHNPPPLSLILPFCKDVQAWLEENPENVAAIHCKAGKGRTGVMICAYLLYAREWNRPDEVMQFFGFARTNNQKGVTIPSQRRFISYFSRLLDAWDQQESGQMELPPATLDSRHGSRLRVENLEEMKKIRDHLQSGEEDDSDTEEEDKAAASAQRMSVHEPLTIPQDALLDRERLAAESLGNLKKACLRYDVDFSGFLEKQEYVTAIFDAVTEEQEESSADDDGGVGRSATRLHPIYNPRAMPSRVHSLVQVFESITHGDEAVADPAEEEDVPDAELALNQRKQKDEVRRTLQDARREVRRRSQPVAQESPQEEGSPSRKPKPKFPAPPVPTQRRKPPPVSSTEGKGPSQLTLLSFPERGAPGPPVALAIVEIVLHGLPKTLIGSYEPIFTIRCGEIEYNSHELFEARRFQQGEQPIIPLPGLAVIEEVLVVFYIKTMIGNVEKLFQCWFHTSFVEGNQLYLTKGELDKACRDKHHKKFPRDFALEIRFEDLDEDATEEAALARKSPHSVMEGAS
uniref:Phosphatidylinositol-3,4,5-trisphosphate 3-phosphatase n=1 Tax=Pinguiococcus pyrenoidosus TaxID=172671 RepID=A0A7R9UGF2_9STRA|mmetsp:Transcript_9910/g.37359  ORF Transcript_9910/g.37359 Transcript_9910/m.37359 type:complete len:655 (+) Transcript_9910:185-2149(+)